MLTIYPKIFVSDASIPNGLASILTLLSDNGAEQSEIFIMQESSVQSGFGVSSKSVRYPLTAVTTEPYEL